MRFRPRLWPSLIALVMVSIMIGLGTWQIHRRVWKEALLATIASRTESAPVSLPTRIDQPQDWAFRRVRLSGRFADDHALWLYGRTLDGKAGIHLLVPLVMEGGMAILVDRGFVPFDHGDTLAPIAAAPAEIQGIVREPEAGGWFIPSNDPDKNIWYSVDIAAMSRATGFQLSPIYVAAAPSGGAGWPTGTGGTEALGIRNEHLNYAIFWYGMALTLTVIYLLSSRARSVSSGAAR